MKLTKIKGYLVSKDGRVFSSKQGRLKQLNATFDNGYRRVKLYDNKAPSTLRVHRLVAEAYLDNPENKPQVNHINGVKHDNRVENLEWCDAKENDTHARDTGLKGGRYRVTEGIILEIELLTYYGLTTRQIEAVVGVSNSTVSLVQKELRGIE